MTDKKKKEKVDLDELILESRRISEDLLKTTIRLDVFVENLLVEAAKLREETSGESDE